MEAGKDMNLIKKNIKRNITGFSLSIVIFLFCASAYGSPKLIVIPEEYKFGEIIEGERVTHIFVVENGGDSDLIINDVKPG